MIQGWIQNVLRGGLNIEMISEVLPTEKLAIGYFINIPKSRMPKARFRTYLSKYKEVLNQIWNRGVVGAAP